MAARIGTCADHPRYVRGCAGCRERARVYWQLRARAVRSGAWDGRPVRGADLEAVRAHVRLLVARPGVTRKLVAQTAGVSDWTVRALIDGTSGAVSPANAEAILGTSAVMCLDRITNPRHLVGSIGTARRLRALMLEGWSSNDLASLAGVTAEMVRSHRQGDRPWITVRLHRIYADLYEKILALPDPRGPSPRVISIAGDADHNYQSYECWPDDDIDNPDAEPLPPPPDTDDHVVISKMVDDALRRPTPGKAADYDRSVKREIARQALGSQLGWSLERVAELLGYSSANSVEYLLNGRKDRPHTRKEQQ